jgi:hypothetical protein
MSHIPVRARQVHIKWVVKAFEHPCHSRIKLCLIDQIIGLVACSLAGSRITTNRVESRRRRRYGCWAAPAYWPRWESAIRAGSREICITPSSGWAMSSIRKIAPETDSAQT